VDVKNYHMVQKKSVSQMKSALAQQPLSVSVDAQPRSFMNYRRGIYDSVPMIPMLDHATLLVGWGNEDGTPYWIMKNSWNTSWGEKGYMRLECVENSVGPAAIQKEPLYPDSN